MKPKPSRVVRPRGSKQRILELLLANIGRVIDHDEIQKASGYAAEWARRVRELRDEQGYQILTHNDRSELKPGQYVLVTDKRTPAFARNISKETRASVLDRNGYTCQMCGSAAGDDDVYHPGRKVRLTMGHIIDKDKGGTDDPGNLRAVCSVCNEGLQNTALPKPDRLHLMKTLRRATVDDQLHALAWLEKKFAAIRPKA